MFSQRKTMKFTEDYSDNIRCLKQEIETADSIVIGAGAGLSTAAGFTYSGERFEKYFSDFIQKYGFSDYGLFQCLEPCCQKTFDNEEFIRRMYNEQKNMRVPFELIPKCPECGKPMTMNLRADDKFVQDEGWYKARERYADFLRRHEGMHMLFLELGVGFNTPVIIKYPFWQITAKNPNAVYACINFNEAFCPEELEKKSICIGGDIAEVLWDMI